MSFFNAKGCIPVAPWLQKSPKTQKIHGIIGISIQHLVPKEKRDY